MIQRVQSIYLLGAVALMLTLFFSPLVVLTDGEGLYSLFATGIKSIDGEMVYPTTYLLIILALTTLLPFVNIFLFKKRMLQMRLCIVEMVLAVGSLLIIGAYYYLGMRFFEIDGAGFDFSSIRIVTVLPVFVIVLCNLAFKAILKDELLIKSVDRIR